MRVAIDTNGLYTTRAGVARYLRGLLAGLRALPPGTAPEWQELAWPVENVAFRQPRRAWRTFYREVLWSRFLAPAALRRGGAQLLHSTATPLLEPPTGIRHVVTLHDLAVLRFPERFRPWHRRSALAGLDRTRRAHRILCISRNTADEAIRFLDLDPRRLEVVYNGCDFHPDSAPAEAPPPGPPPDAFFLFVGSLEPGKNLALLRAMYDLAATRNLRLPDLVIVGARWSGLASEGPPPAGWHYLGHVPDPALVWLYRRAVALLFPSKYEGFGLPVVEAMNLGCPVVCSPVASLPEVGGEAALYAPPTPEDYLAAAQRLLTDAAERQRRAEAGRVQAARFHWSTCAAQTVEVYRHTLEAS